jgi:hypothetical protein
MGTNFYWIDRDQTYCGHCERGGEEIHIGKSSGGWSFSFHAVPSMGLTSAKAWREYMETSKDHGHIRDEYRDKVATEEFWRIVEAKRDGKKHAEYVKSGGPWGRDDGSYLDEEGNSLSPGVFS